MFFIIFSADLTLTILRLLDNKRYIKQYDILASDELTSLFLLITFYYFIVSYMIYIFTKLKYINIKSCGPILIMLFITPITYILFCFLN